jgi:hypothetical protein
MTAGRRCRPETAVAGQTTVPCVRLQDTEDASTACPSSPPAQPRKDKSGGSRTVAGAGHG